MVNETFSQLIEQAKKMQEKMEEVRSRLNETEVVGESGTGWVQVVMNGKYDAKRVNLDAQILQEKKEIIEDLITAAINDATTKVERKNREQFPHMIPNLPAGFKWPL